MKPPAIKLPRIFLIVPILALVALALSACVPQIGTEKKSVSAGEFKKGEIVDKFPKNIPIYKNSQIIESYGNRQDFGAFFVVDAKLGNVLEFYNKALPTLGWQSEARQKSETNYIFEIKNEEYSGSVIVNTASDGKSTAITIDITHR